MTIEEQISKYDTVFDEYFRARCDLQEAEPSYKKARDELLTSLGLPSGTYLGSYNGERDSDRIQYCQEDFFNYRGRVVIGTTEDDMYPVKWMKKFDWGWLVVVRQLMGGNDTYHHLCATAWYRVRELEIDEDCKHVIRT